MEQRANAAGVATYTASGVTAGVGAVTVNELVALGGLLIAFATFCINWYYRHKHYHLTKQEIADAKHRTLDE